MEPEVHPPDHSPDPKPQQGLMSRFMQGIKRVLRAIAPSHIPKEAWSAVTATLVTALATLSIAIANLANGLNERIAASEELLLNTQLTTQTLQLQEENYHQSVLDSYLQTVHDLIGTDPNPSKVNVAILRALTQATLNELDGKRRRYVVLFLRDAGLIYRSSPSRIVNWTSAPLLAQANLSSTNLQNLDLSDVDFRGADLSFSNLQGAILRRADLRGSNLESANLKNACYDGQTQLDILINPIDKKMKIATPTHDCVAEPWMDSL